MLTRIKETLRIDEGRNNKIYFDTLGVPTVGVGHNLNKPLSIEAIEQILEDDLHDAYMDCLMTFGEELWLKISVPRRDALLNMMFNLGYDKFSKFKKMIACVKSLDWDGATLECLDSKWAKQVGKRSHRIAQLLQFEIYDYNPTKS